MLNGMVITFANAAVVTDLNKANPIIKMNDRQILLKGVAFAGEEAAIANRHLLSITHSSKVLKLLTRKMLLRRHLL